MIFKKWDNVYNYKDKMFILVDNNYKVDNTNRSIKDFSSFNLSYKYDFINSNNDDFLLYVAYRREFQNWNTKIPAHFDTFIFKKNKFYDFQNFKDELGNDVVDVWYDPFVFVKVEDFDQAVRYLKMTKLNKI